MKVRFIYNPNSGPSGARAAFERRLRAWVGERGLSAELVRTDSAGHAERLAAEAIKDGIERVVAIGGDGTLNETARRLIGTDVALAVVPRGSGNGLARHLGIPLDPIKALELAVDPAAPHRRIDVGMGDAKPFFNVMGMGLDAEIGRRFSTSAKRGLASYLAIALSAWRHRTAETYEIVDRSGTTVVTALLVAVANSPQYGNGVVIAPGAQVDDGLLHVVAIPPLSLVGSLNVGCRLFNRTVDRYPGVTSWVGSTFTLRRKGPGWIHRDGEAEEAGSEFEVRVLPRALSVVVPATR